MAPNFSQLFIPSVCINILILGQKNDMQSDQRESPHPHRPIQDCHTEPCPNPHNSCCCLNPQRMYIVKIRVRLSEMTRVGPWTNRIGFFVRRGTQSSLSRSPSPQALRKRHAEPPASQDAPSPETSLASTLTWDSSLQNYGQIPVVLAIHPVYGIWLWQFKLVYIGTKCKLLNSFFKSLLTLP